MAEKAGSHKYLVRGALRSEWTDLGSSGDTGSPLDAPHLPDKTVQVLGTFTTAQIVIEGSNNTATGPYHTLNDSRGEGNALTFTAADTRTILENPAFLRWRFTSGTITGGAVRIMSQSTKR